MTRWLAVAASVIALVLGAATNASALVYVDGSWTGTVTWDTVENDQTFGTVTRQTGSAQFKGTGRTDLDLGFDLWEIDVDWTEKYTHTDDGSFNGEPCSAAGTGSGSQQLAGRIEFDSVWPALDIVDVELDPDTETYPVQGSCYPYGGEFVRAHPVYSSPNVNLPDGRATTTLKGKGAEAGGGISSEWTWHLTRKPDADCDGIPDASDTRAGRPCNFTRTHIDPIERTRRKLKIDGFVDPHWGPEVRMTVRLLRKKSGRFRLLETKHPSVDETLEYKAKFARPEAGRCRVNAKFPGNSAALPSQARKTFDC